MNTDNTSTGLGADGAAPGGIACSRMEASGMRRSVLLGCVQETALIPLYARVLESRRKRPILEDRKAIEMVEAIDWDFGRFGQRRRLVGCALRSAMFDGWWWRSAPIQIAASRPAFLAVRVQLLGGQLL